jgi:hypothetical protein
LEGLTVQARIAAAIKPGDPYTGSYANLKAWPRDKAGPPPSRDNIIAARGLVGSNRPSKRELAVAAYLRSVALKYHTNQVALALQLVCGGSLNPLLNVANRDLERKWNLGKVHKVKIEGGTAYQFRPNETGLRRIEKFKAGLGAHPEPVVAPERDGNAHGHAPAEANAGDAAVAASTAPDIEADVEQIRNRGDLAETEREILIQARLGQGRYRQQVMELWDGRCAVTGCSVEAVLEACHLKPWKISTDLERLDPENGLCLVSNLHRLLDHGLVTFDDDGLMRVSKRLPREDQMSLKLDGRMRIKSTLTAKQKVFLKLHRETCFE